MLADQVMRHLSMSTDEFFRVGGLVACADIRLHEADIERRCLRGPRIDLRQPDETVNRRHGECACRHDDAPGRDATRLPARLDAFVDCAIHQCDQYRESSHPGDIDRLRDRAERVLRVADIAREQQWIGEFQRRKRDREAPYRRNAQIALRATHEPQNDGEQQALIDAQQRKARDRQRDMQMPELFEQVRDPVEATRIGDRAEDRSQPQCPSWRGVTNRTQHRHEDRSRSAQQIEIQEAKKVQHRRADAQGNRGQCG